jgi:Xaa-Pro aminopeptidase
MTEFEKRLGILRRGMESEGVDLVAIGPTANTRYLVGFASHPDERLCLLLVSREVTSAVVPGLNAGEWAAHTDLPLYVWSDDEGPTEALSAALSGTLPVRRLAIDGATRSDFLLPLLTAANPQETTTIALLGISLCLHKSADEIEAMQQAAAQADRAMQRGIDTCEPGVTEAQVAWAIEEAFRLDGAEEVCFTLVASGPNGAFPHHHSGDRTLEEGDAIVIDIGASLKGYKSDITRVVFLGQPPPEFLAVYQAVLDANERARAAVRPGVTAGKVDSAARTTLEAAGYGEYFVHRTGHGLGLEIHEPPWIVAGSQQILEEGMAFSIEPGVYIPGQFGVRIEDVVVVTETGAINLTGFGHQLIVKS